MLKVTELGGTVLGHEVKKSTKRCGVKDQLHLCWGGETSVQQEWMMLNVTNGPTVSIKC